MAICSFKSKGLYIFNQNIDTVVDDQSDNYDSDEFCKFESSGQDENWGTLLDNVLYNLNQTFTFDRWQGQHPLSLYQDQMAEYFSFPTIFCGKGRIEDDQHQVHVS